MYISPCPLLRLCSICLIFADAPPAAAQDLAAAGLDVSATIGALTDYRFRGQTYSNHKPVVQGGIELGYQGFFAGTWGSNVADYGGAKVEVDLYGGYGGSIGDLSYTATAYGYFYPGGKGTDYAETQLLLSHPLGSTTAELEINYVPHQKNTGVDNIYLGGRMTWPVAETGVALIAHGGYESGFYKDKLDWELGVSYTTGPITATLSAIGTDGASHRRLGASTRTGVVASVILSL